MKILHGILVTILIICFATAFQGAFAHEYDGSKYTESGLYQFMIPAMETSSSSDVGGVGSTSSSTRGVTGDEATTIINNVNGMIRTIMISSIVIILLIIALVYFFINRRRGY